MSSAGKESTCNAGDLGLIPGSGRFPEEGIGYPFQYSWVSLGAQTVKNLPAMQKTWVRSQEDPLEKGMKPTPIFLPEKPMDRGPWRAAVHGVAKELVPI